MQRFKITFLFIILLLLTTSLFAQTDAQIGNIKGRRYNAPAIRTALETVQDSVAVFTVFDDSVEFFSDTIKVILDSLETFSDSVHVFTVYNDSIELFSDSVHVFADSVNAFKSWIDAIYDSLEQHRTDGGF